VNTLKEGGMLDMPEATPRSDDWKMLTLVGLAHRLAIRTSPTKSEEQPDTHKNRQRISIGIFRIIRSMILPGATPDAAVDKLRNLDKARVDAVAEFAARMPDKGKVYAPSGSFAEPASPEEILKAFCLVALRVRATAPEATLSDITWHTFKHVVAPHLAIYLGILESNFCKPEQWPADRTSKTGREIIDWRMPRMLLAAVKDGTFAMGNLSSAEPFLCLPEFKAAALDPKNDFDPECAKIAILLRVLLQQCSTDDQSWKIARGLCAITLRMMEASGHQAAAALADPAPSHLKPSNMAEFCDRTSSAIFSDLSRRSENLDQKLNMPLTRRRILSFTPFITDPTSDDLDLDFDGSVRVIRARLEEKKGEEWAKTCMGYAYFMSRRCLVQDRQLTPGEETAAEEAASLAYILMVRAFQIGDPATKQIALRYLAGFSTNPRFRCGALAQKEAKRWVETYEARNPKEMSKLFLGRLAFINGDIPKARKLYVDSFMRAIPPDFIDEKYSPLEDHEALAYLLPECYALVEGLEVGQKPEGAEESVLQTQIRRAAVAHFGIECSWPKEAKRIKLGFEYRKGLLNRRVTPKS
jgi:hypothetical protein